MAKHFIRMLNSHLGGKIAFEQFAHVLQSLGEPREVTDISLTLKGRTYYGFLVWYLKRFPKPESGYDLGGICVEFKFQKSAALLFKVKSFLENLTSSRSPISVTKAPTHIFVSQLRSFLESNTDSSSSTTTSLVIENGRQDLVANLHRVESGKLNSLKITFPRKKLFLKAFLKDFRKIEKKGTIMIEWECLGHYSIRPIKSPAKGDTSFCRLVCGANRLEQISESHFASIVKQHSGYYTVRMKSYGNDLKVVLSSSEFINTDLNEKKSRPNITFYVPGERRRIDKALAVLRKGLPFAHLLIDLSCFKNYSLKILPRDTNGSFGDEIPF